MLAEGPMECRNEPRPLAALKRLAASFQRDLQVYRRAVVHPRTPRLAKLLLGGAIGYALLPLDVIPDFIPAIGHLDDLVIVPLVVADALKLIPGDVLEECRTPADASVHEE